MNKEMQKEFFKELIEEAISAAVDFGYVTKLPITCTMEEHMKNCEYSEKNLNDAADKLYNAIDNLLGE